jgi:hypothetical protein
MRVAFHRSDSLKQESREAAKKDATLGHEISHVVQAKGSSHDAIDTLECYKKREDHILWLLNPMSWR